MICFECASIVQAIICFWASALSITDNNDLSATIFTAVGIFFIFLFVFVRSISYRIYEERISDLEKELENLKEKNK